MPGPWNALLLPNRWYSMQDSTLFQWRRGWCGILIAGLSLGCGSANGITDAAVTQVAIAPAGASVAVGATVTLQATAFDASGTEVRGKSVLWTSAAATVASVTSTGVVTGVTPGTARITATVDNRSANTDITVTPGGTPLATIAVNGAQRFQTMTGWEALAEIGQVECDPRAYATFKNEVLDRAANELGINRIRMGLRNGFENPQDQFIPFRAGQLTFNQWKVFWFQVVNDNNDPFVINPAGFTWGYLDYTMDELIVPLKQRLAARGEPLWLNLSYTGANSGQLHRDNPDEYAEFVLAAFQHLQQRYGFVPNSLELVNEPDLGTWTPTHIARNLAAVKPRLAQAGFTPDFIGPSSSTVSTALQNFDGMIPQAGVAQGLDAIVYHRYGTPPSIAQLQGLAQRGSQFGMRTAMLEHGGSGHEDLHADLTLANISAWQQFGLAFCGDRDIGGNYFPIFGGSLGNNTPVVRTGEMTKFLRQYFRYVALGAERVGATTANAQFAPVGFRNSNGKFVVVVKASAGGSFSISGLPAGTYGIDYTTASAYMVPLANQTITGAQLLSTAIPAAGVLTVFAR